MADIYVDPSAATNGSGSEASPRTIWPTSIGANDRILLKRGTTLAVAAQLSLGAGSSVTVMDYGDAALPRPRITSTATNFGSINVDVAGVVRFRNIHFDQFLNGSTNGAVIVASPVAAGRVAQLDIQGCRFSSCAWNAIRLNGTNTATAALTFRCVGNEFDDIGEDCVFGGALDVEFAYNRCTRLSSRTLTGDGLGFINADPVRVWVHPNYIDHSLTDCKQCVIVDCTTPGAGEVIIEDNVLIGFGSATAAPTLHSVIISEGKTKIRRNTIYAYGIVCGINNAQDEIADNLIYLGNNAAAIGPPIAIAADGKVLNNTIIGVGSLPANTPAIVMGSGATAAAIVRNNAFINLPRGIQSNVAAGVNPTVGTNAYWQVPTPRTGTTGAFAEASAITADPKLAADGRPMPGSSLIRAGTHAGYRRDRARTQRSNPPCIGAFDVARVRLA